MEAVAEKLVRFDASARGIRMPELVPPPEYVYTETFRQSFFNIQ